MNKLEQDLKELIIANYGNLKRFTDIIDMPWTTLDSILKRGVNNSSISNILKICRELNIDVEKLADGEIIFSTPVDKFSTTNSIDVTKYTKAELDEITRYAEFLKQKDTNKDS